LRLKKTRAGDNDNNVTPTCAAGFEQKRDIENDRGNSAAALAPQKILFGSTDQGMNNRLQPLQRRTIAKHHPTQTDAIDAAINDRAGKSGVDRRNRFSALGKQSVDRRIGIVDRQTKPGQHPRRRAFPSTDRAGQADDLHGSDKTKVRNASVTSG
jgi:hypothetical protein